MEISYHNNSNTAEYAKTLEQTTPEGCDLQVGDIVTFVNDYGIPFPGKEVIGFDTDCYMNKYGNFIHIDTGAYWYPHKRCELIKESKEDGEARLQEWIKNHADKVDR